MPVTITPFTPPNCTPDSSPPGTFTPPASTPDSSPPNTFTPPSSTPDSSPPTTFFAPGMNVPDLTAIRAIPTAPVPSGWAGLAPGFGTSVLVAGVFYHLVAGVAAESVPSVIHPNDYDASTNAKTWQTP